MTPNRPLTLTEIEALPEFGTLSAQNQMQIRAEFFDKRIASTPEFQQLRPWDKLGIQNEIFSRAPVLGTQDQRAHELFGLTQRFRSGDATAGEALSQFFNQRMTEDFGIWSPIGRAIARSQGHELYGDAEDPTIAQDRAKAYEYFMRTVRTSQETQGWAKAQDTLIPLAGWITSALGLKLASAATLSGIGSLALKGSAMQAGASNMARLILGGSKFAPGAIPQSTNRLVSWWMTAGAPNVFSSVFDATFQTVGGFRNEDYRTQLLAQPDIERSMLDIALRFGTEFAMDYGAWVGLQAVGYAAKTTYHSFKGSIGRQTLTEAAARDQADHAARYLQGKLSPEELSKMSAADRIRYKHMSNMHQINSVIGGHDPTQVAVAKGFQIVPSTQGKKSLAEVENFLDSRMAQIKELDRIYQESLDQARKGLNAGDFEGLAKATEALEEAHAAQLRQIGTELRSIDQWDLFDLRGSKPRVVGTYTNPDEALSGMFNRVGRELNEPMSDAVAARGGMSLNQESVVRVRTEVTAPIKGTLKDEELLRFRELLDVGRLSKGDAHVIDTNKVKGFVETLGKKVDPDGQTFRNIEIRRIGTNEWNQMDNIVQGDVLYVPARLGGQSPQGLIDEVLLGNRILDGLGQRVPQGTSKQVWNDMAKELKQELVGQVDRGPTLSWAKTQLSMAYPDRIATIGPMGEIVLRKPGVPDLKFSSETALMENLFEQALAQGRTKHTMFEMLQRHLKQNFKADLEIKADPNGIERLVLRDRRGVQTFSSVDELLEAKPFYRPKLPVDMAPRFQVQPSKGQVTFAGDVFTGSYEDVFQELSNYVDPKVTSKLKGIKDYSGASVKLNEATKVYEIDIPGLNYSGRFSSLEEVQEFMRTGINNSSNLTFIAGQKGAQAVWTHHGWTVRTIDGKTFTARNVDELAQVVRDLPLNPKYGPDLLDLSPELKQIIQPEFEDMLNEVQTSLNFWSKSEIDNVINANLASAKFGVDRPGWLGVSMATRLRPETIKDIAMSAGNRPLLGALNQFENGVDLVNARKARISGDLAEIWTDIKPSDRIALLPLLEYPQEQWTQVWSKIHSNRELTPRLFGALQKQVDLFKNLSNEFGIDVYKFQTQYLPRIRQYAMQNQDQIMKQFASSKNPDMFVFDTLQKQFGAKNELFFAQNMRIDEFYNLASSLDPVDLTMSYVSSGLKAKHMAPAYNQMRDLVNKAGANLTPTQTEYIMTYVSDSMGGIQDLTRKATNEAFNAMLSTFNRKGLLSGDMGQHLKTNQDFLRTLQNLTVSATMAFRPGLVLRNNLQIWTVGSLYAPIDAIQEGVSRVTKKLNTNPDEFIRDMINKAVVKPGMTPLGPMQGNFSGPLAKLNQLGMQSYMNSDTINRSVMYHAVEALHERAMVKHLKKPMSLPEFMSWTEADLLPKADMDQFMHIWKTQGDIAAKHFHASRVVGLTQFPYIKAHNPKFAQGTMLGEAFGMFMHYPMSYAETLRKVLAQRKGSALARTAYRFGIATGAVVGANRVLGLDPTNYTPWGQMAMTGGPHFHFGLQMLQSLNFKGYEGAQARANLLRNGSRLFFPGSAAFRAIGQAFELADSGDTYGAWMKAMSLPYIGFD